MLYLNKNSSKKIQLCLSYCAFFLSGTGIFHPFKGSDNIIISLATSLIVSSVILFILLHITEKYKVCFEKKTAAVKINVTVISAGCVFSLLLLLTEVVKDTSFITNRGISLMYYTAISISVLLVNLFLSGGTGRGIFRFLVISFITYFTLFLISYLPFTTVKGAVSDFSFSKNSVLSSVLSGVKAGTFLTADSVFFILLFKELYESTKQKQRCFFTSLMISFVYIFSSSLIPCLVFGTELSGSLDMPDYSLSRLVYGFDITEFISGLRIVSFLIKGSVYMSLCTKLITSSSKRLQSKTGVLLFLHLLLPTAFLSLAVFDNSLGYGSLQHLIIPVSIITSIVLMIYIFVSEKSNT